MNWRPLGTGSEPQPVGEGLDRLVRQYGMPSSSALSSLFERWPELVGAAISGNCWPLKLERDGVLVVGSAASAWATQLRLIESDLIEKLNRELGAGTIRQVKVRITPSRPPA